VVARHRRHTGRPPTAAAPPAGRETIELPTTPASQDSAVRETGELPATEKAPKGHRSITSQLLELPLLIIIAFGIAVLIKIFLVQAFFIPSASMVPTLRVGDRVLVEKLGYRFGDPERGQVIVFERFLGGRTPPDLPWQEDARNFIRELFGLPTGTQQDFIKRIVGVGGDVISYSGKPRRLVVNGTRIDEPYVARGVDRSSGTITPDNCRSMRLRPVSNGCRVPVGTVFVMGDNRSNSQDSRFFGPVGEGQIVGRAFVVIWPPKDFGGI
jgi:signal peptidase I